MDASSSQARPGLLKSLVELVFYGGIALAFGGYAYTHFFGNPFASILGDNLLETATNVGISDKASMDAFKNAGGLDYESTWKGFKVMKYEAVYHPDGKLGMVTLTLAKSWPAAKLASLDNLQAAMSGKCGSSWTRSNDLNVGVLQAKAAPAGVACSALDQGKDAVVVSIANVTATDSSPSGAAPQPQTPANPAPPAATTADAGSPAQAPVSSQAGAAEASVRTVAGDLVAAAKASGGSLSLLKLAGRVVFDASDSMISVEKSFTLEGKTVVLLSISDGGTACPAVYRILSIAPDGRTFTSDEFGTCSDTPKVTAGQSSLMISMPNMDGNDDSSWMFAGETLNQVRGGSRKK